MNPLFSRCLAALCAAVAIVTIPAAAGAQSLADVARTEQARRKEQPAPSKVYTNDSVKSDITPSTPDGGAPAGGATPAVSAPADSTAAETPAGGGQVRDQKFWHDRMSGAREQLERSKTFAEALQTRVNALSADFINRDDPAQQAVIGQNRSKAVAELDRVQREIAAQNKAIAAIEDDARKAGVPPGWLR